MSGDRNFLGPKYVEPKRPGPKISGPKRLGALTSMGQKMARGKNVSWPRRAETSKTPLTVLQGKEFTT